MHCITAPNTQTHKHLATNTSVLLYSKLATHMQGLYAPKSSILAVLSLKTPYLHSVSCLSLVPSYAKGTQRAYRFIKWQNNMPSSNYKPKVTVWDSVQNASQIDYSSPQTIYASRLYFISKTQIKPAIVFFVKSYSKVLVKKCTNDSEYRGSYAICSPKKAPFNH